VVDFKRISAEWYLFILLVFPAVSALSILLHSLLGDPPSDFDVLAQIVANPTVLVGMVIGGIITGPLSEELGWRGFALDELRARWSPLVSSLIIAPFWWAWHLPLFFMSGTTQHVWGFGTPSFWLFMIGTAPLCVLLTWVYQKNDRSILAAVLLHFTYNFTLGLVPTSSVADRLSHVILLFVTGVALVLIDRARLTSSPSTAD
jgi:membrane protease YdiL (CAAX protease family)